MSVSGTPSSSEKMAQQSVQVFSIYSMDVPRATKSLLTKKEGVALKTIINRIVIAYNHTKDSSVFEPITDFKQPTWSVLEKTEPVFEMSVFVQKVPIVSKVTQYLQSLGSQSAITAQKVSYLFFFHRFKLVDDRTPASAEVFILASGDSRHVIKDYVNYQFPSLIAQRLLDADNITRHKERFLVGPVFTGSATNRHSESLRDPLDILIQSISCKLRSNASIYCYPCFQSVKKKPLNLSFEIGLGMIRINKEIHMNDYTQVFAHFSRIMRKETTRCYGKELDEEDSPAFNFLHYFESISGNRTQAFEKELDQLIWLSFNKGHDLMMDFCHKDASDYFNATEYRLNYSGSGPKTSIDPWHIPESATEMLNKLRALPAFSSELTKDSFLTQLENVTVSFQSKGVTKLLRFRDFLEGEVRLDTGESYWRLRNRWYSVAKDYLSFVQEKLIELLKKSLLPQSSNPLSIKWYSPKERAEEKAKVEKAKVEKLVGAKRKREPTDDSKTAKFDAEGEYNKKYLPKRGWIFGDKLCVNGIELFDLLHFDDSRKTIQIIHVKEGFGQKTRDACSQLYNAAKLFHDALRRNGSTNCLIEFYRKTVGYEGKSAHLQDAKKKLLELYPKKENFLNLFNKPGYKLEFIYAFIDDADKCRLIETEKTISPLIAANLKPIYATDCDAVFRVLKQLRIIDNEGSITAKFLASNQDKFVTLFSEASKKADLKLKTTQTQALYIAIRQHCSQFDSSIAKLELLHLDQTLRNLGFEFKIVQILRNDYSEADLSACIPVVVEGSGAPVICTSVDSEETHPHQIIGEGSTVTIEGKKYKILTTRPDGACGLHAMLGVVDKEGLVTYDKARVNFKTELAKSPLDPEIKTILYEHLNDLLNQKKGKDPTNEAKLVFSDLLYKDFANTLYTKYLTDELKLKEARDDKYRQILDLDNPALVAIFQTVDSFNSRLVSLKEKSNKQDRINFFDPLSRQIFALEGINEVNQLKSLNASIETCNQEFETAQKAWLEKDEIMEAYLNAILDQSYYLTDLELKVAAIIFKRQISLISEYFFLDKASVLNFGTEGEKVVIFHRDNHYSQCALK